MSFVRFHNFVKDLHNTQQTFMNSSISNLQSIVPSILQTKQWRKNETWYINGKHNECEIYQRELVAHIMNQPCHKTRVRINVQDYRMQTNPNPMKQVDGFDWTEDFDGYIKIQETELYFNFKMVCDAGGSQTRTLREVYHFVQSQLQHLLTYPESHSIYFINILDGDASNSSMPKFAYLLNQPKYIQVKNRVYIGDMLGFKESRHLPQESHDESSQQMSDDLVY